VIQESSTTGASSRQQVRHGGRLIANLYQRQNSDGEIRFEFLGMVKGKRIRRTLDAKTPTEAVAEIDRLRPVVRDQKIGDRSVRVGALYENMLAAMRSGEFTFGGKPYAERTISLMEQRAESHVLDALGRSTRVADVKAAHLRSMMRRLTKKGLSGSSVRGCLSVASALLRYGVEIEVIERNVAQDISRGERPSSKRLSEPKYLSVSEVEYLLSKLSDESRPICAAMFWAALRVSEALALRWADVDFDNNVIHVRGTKTEASAASVPLLAPLAAELKAHRERSGIRGFGRIGQEALIFATDSGKPTSRRNVLRAVQGAGERAGLHSEESKLGCHDLRHSMCANALGIGLSLTEASKLMRHANPGVTQAVYADLTAEGTEGIAAKLAALG
jgi:integrase